MELDQLKQELIRRFDSLDVMMRGIEIDSDETMKGHPMGRVTFGSILDTIPVYTAVAENTGELSENLQRKLHEVVTEMFVIVSRAHGDDVIDEFDVEELKRSIDDCIISVPDLAHAHLTLVRVRDVYEAIRVDGMPPVPDDQEKTRIADVMRWNVLKALAAAVVVEDLLLSEDIKAEIEKANSPF